MNRKSIDSRASRGFAVIILLVFLPVIFVMVSYGLLRLSQLSDLRWLRENCRQTLLPAQERAGDAIQTLLRLNLVVRELKIEKMAALSALAIATATYNIPGVSAARNWLVSIQRRQRALRVQQITLIRLTEVTLTTAKYRVKQSTEMWSLSQRMLYRTHIESAGLTPAKLAVRVTSLDEFPEYELEPSFSSRQALEFNWLVTFTSRASGVKKWIPFNIKVPERCGATLVENRGSFATKLHQARFF